MTTIHLEADQVPAVLRAGYDGRKFKVRIAETVTLQNTYWSGGTRSTYELVEIATGRTIQPAGSADPPAFGGTLEGRYVDIPRGYVLREHSTFCGKDMGLTFHARAEDLAPMLPKPAAISEHEKIVLAATAGLKASYGGIPNFRFTQASRATGITLEQWDAAKTACIAAGYLNKAGAITPKGRNAVGDYRI